MARGTSRSEQLLLEPKKKMSACARWTEGRPPTHEMSRTTKPSARVGITFRRRRGTCRGVVERARMMWVVSAEDDESQLKFRCSSCALLLTSRYSHPFNRTIRPVNHARLLTRRV